MNTFYFVRHGESVWNTENKICGIYDSPLTEKGIRQAEICAGKIVQAINAGDMHIDGILASPLQRAFKTAEIISNKTNIPVKEEPRLMEQNFGIWEGTARNGKEFSIAKQHFIDNYGTGESMLKTAQRIYNLLDDIHQSDKTFLLVAHNGLARIIESYFHDMSNEEFAAFGIMNAEIREYHFKF